MTIYEIFKKNEISHRSFNICKRCKIFTINDLIQFYNKNKTFIDLRNCGIQSNHELISICERYSKNDQNQNKFSEKEAIFNFNRDQREVINSFIFANTESLSVRSKNAITKYLKNGLRINNFVEKVFNSKTFDLRQIKNVGAKSIQELEQYISTIKDFVAEVSNIQDEKYLIALKNKFLIKRTFNISSVPSDILQSDSIFKLTNFLLDQNAFFDPIPTLIIKRSLNLYYNQENQQLDDVATEVNLSKERVRQIRKKCSEELFDKLTFICSFNEDLLQKYNIDIESNIINISTDDMHRINNMNKTQFSKEFITFILGAYLKGKFCLIGNYEDVLQPNYFTSSKRHKWKNFYLVEQSLSNEINIADLTNDIHQRITERIDEQYSFNFKSYLSKFLSDYSVNKLDLISTVCEMILFQEFQIYLDEFENINFKRNTIHQAHEYAFEALLSLGQPSKVEDIVNKVKELNPDYDTDEAKIRAAMKRKLGFVPIGRSSVFGLKKWEKEMDDFKGGTIREIAEQFLLTRETPVKHQELVRHVLQYRPKSNHKSIIYNLKLEENGLFCFYRNMRVGLSSKKYDDKFILENNKSFERKSWDERFEMLVEFTFQKKRLPYSISAPEDEIKLYRWISTQKVRIKKNKLSKSQEQKLNTLLDNFKKTWTNRN